MIWRTGRQVVRRQNKDSVDYLLVEAFNGGKYGLLRQDNSPILMGITCLLWFCSVILYHVNPSISLEPRFI
jgi:hypothetical protein